MNLIILVLPLSTLLLSHIKLASSLECYVCERQEDNFEKCAKTIKTCQQEEDYCLTEVSWGSTPYWTQGAKKQYYISKQCSTKQRCQNQRNANWPICTYLWYEDWRCTDCCRGDRCNYYIFSDSEQSTISMGVLSLCLLAGFLRLF